MATKRISREIKQLKKDLKYHRNFISFLEIHDDNILKWKCKYRNGHKVKILFHEDYPFEPPLIKTDLTCDQIDPTSWSPAATGMMVLAAVHQQIQPEIEQRKKRWMGLLMAMPMMMLWRKRATERLYHPSRMDFSI